MRSGQRKALSLFSLSHTHPSDLVSLGFWALWSWISRAQKRLSWTLREPFERLPRRSQGLSSGSRWMSGLYFSLLAPCFPSVRLLQVPFGFFSFPVRFIFCFLFFVLKLKFTFDDGCYTANVYTVCIKPICIIISMTKVDGWLLLSEILRHCVIFS